LEDAVDLRVFPTDAALAETIARALLAKAVDVLAKKPFFALAVSGGAMTLKIFHYLSSQPLVNEMPWPLTKIFWADERFAPMDSPDSNAGTLLAFWGRNLPLPWHNLFPVATDKPSAEEAAKDYDATLRRELAGRAAPLDLILLGVGPDGHTASLFPGHKALDEKDKWALPVHDSPKPPPDRVTFSLPFINASEEAWFIITGAAKKDIVKKILNDPAADLPAQKIKPASGKLVFWTDEAASPK
jgi:6-phosphogluconolactonase